jgi:hypothetical protein
MGYADKKVKAIATLIFFCVVVGFLSSMVALGYLTAGDSAVNEFEAGETECYIKEDFPEPSVTPDGFVKKEIIVVNSGNLPAFARLRIVFSDDKVRENLSLAGVDEKNWTYDARSDFYYYQGQLAAGETVKFMDGIRFDLAEDDCKTEDFQVSVYVELWDGQGVNSE